MIARLHLLVILLILSLSVCSQKRVASHQGISKSSIIGDWKLEKIVVSKEVFFDLGDKDSTRRNYLRQYKEKQYNSAWTFEDSSTIELLYAAVMLDLEQTSIEFRKDNTYMAKAGSRGKDKVDSTEQGSYSINSSKTILKIFVGKSRANLTKLTIVSLTESTLILSGPTDRSPTMTYKRYVR